MLRITPTTIKYLKQNEVFVFGTNEQGFHGAGAAGQAFRYDNSCNWRQDNFFLNASMANASLHERTGKWAVYGQAKGLMYGREGKSYGIVTIKRPGQKRSLELSKINTDVQIFTDCAKLNPQYIFFVTEIGCKMAGYTVEEIAPFFRKSAALQNVYLPQSFWDVLLK
jgi:hypothetical protein